MAFKNKTLKDIINFSFLLKEEKVEYNNEYIEGSLKSQASSVTYYLFKLVYLLPREEQGQDKNHWKGELRNSLKHLLSNLGGVKNPNLILDKLNKMKGEAYNTILLGLKNKYYGLMNPKELTIDMVNDIAEKYYPVISNWLFSNFKEVQKNKKDIIGLVSLKASEFVNDLFE